jgi:hypothetical protein
MIVYTIVIASRGKPIGLPMAKQSKAADAGWIASSLAVIAAQSPSLLAMTNASHI